MARLKAFIWGKKNFCTMDGFFRILQKALSELICTRLYLLILVFVQFWFVNHWANQKMFTWKRSGSNQNYQDKNDFGKNALFLQWVKNLWLCLCDILNWPVVQKFSELFFRIFKKFPSPANMFRIVIEHFIFSLTQMIMLQPVSPLLQSNSSFSIKIRNYNWWQVNKRLHDFFLQQTWGLTLQRFR